MSTPVPFDSEAWTNEHGLLTPPDSPHIEFATWGSNTEEDLFSNLEPWAQPITTQAWGMDYPLDIYVLGNGGEPGHWVHYDHWNQVEDWKYIPFPFPGQFLLPRETYFQANMEAR
ncbi:hypothetical protein FRC11_003259, partial [Ceratobasidium sp. 423]